MKPAPLALLSTLSIGLLGYAFYVLTIPSEPRPRNLGSEEAVAPPAPRYEAEEAPVVRVFGEAGTFAGVGEVGSEGILRPVKVLQSGAGGLMSEPDSAQD